MSDVTFPSSPVLNTEHALSGVRVSGGISVHVDAPNGRSRVADVRERDGYKVRFPRRSDPPEAIIINTGGGLASGDSIEQQFTVDEAASLTVTTQASERSYRAMKGATTRLDIKVTVGEKAALKWLPQETILFDRTRLTRSIEVDLAASSRMLAAETVVFGRMAMGETLQSGLFADKWRVRRDNRLVFAENIRLDDKALQSMTCAAMSGGAHVAVTMVYCAPDAEGLLGRVRSAIAEAPFHCAASAWNGMIVLRGLAQRSEDVRHVMAEVVPALGTGPLPRVWWT